MLPDPLAPGTRVLIEVEVVKPPYAGMVFVRDEDAWFCTEEADLIPESAERVRLALAYADARRDWLEATVAWHHSEENKDAALVANRAHRAAVDALDDYDRRSAEATDV